MFWPVSSPSASNEPECMNVGASPTAGAGGPASMCSDGSSRASIGSLARRLIQRYSFLLEAWLTPGLPVGAQIVGPPFEDDTAIKFAPSCWRNFIGGYEPPPLGLDSRVRCKPWTRRQPLAAGHRPGSGRGPPTTPRRSP